MVTTERVTTDFPGTSTKIAGIIATEDCDDKFTTCHSGTGTSEDYETTGNVHTEKIQPYTHMDM